MNLLEFYNDVFVLEVEDIMRNQDNVEFLLTPIRKEHLNHKKLTGTIPPISNFAKLSSPRQGLGKNKPSLGYQKK